MVVVVVLVGGWVGGWPQDGPKQDGTNMTPRWPKMRPRWAKMAARWLQEWASLGAIDEAMEGRRAGSHWLSRAQTQPPTKLTRKGEVRSGSDEHRLNQYSCIAVQMYGSINV